MNVAIRVDSSSQIGTGHFMRCLTLATELKSRGVMLLFICRHLPDYMQEVLKVKKLNYILLHNTENKSSIDELPHSHWLGVSQQQDAKDTLNILNDKCWDWLIVDHYALDSRWESIIRLSVKKIFVIDDIADRKHDCHSLLDQTFLRSEKDYKNLVPQTCQLLLGTQYALLRPEFSQWRKRSLMEKNFPKLKNILISIGGIDEKNMTEQVLNELKTCELPDDISITVIMGKTSRYIKKTLKIAAEMPYETKVKVNVENMAEIMAKTDLAIGASGSTTWERCCLGVPTIQIVVADNQKDIAQNLSKVNVVKNLKSISDLSLAINEIVKKLKKISILSSVITNGDGCRLVCDYLHNISLTDNIITLKPAGLDDCEYNYSLQTTAARKHSRNKKKPSWKEHVNWYKRAIEDNNTILFIITQGQLSVGILRFDCINTDEIEVSIIISPDYSGHGIAKKSLLIAINILPGIRLKAVVHNENIPSQNIFKKLGFDKTDKSGCFDTYVRNNN